MRRKNNDGGYIIVTVAILSVVLVGFVALGVDMALLYDSRTTAQHAADAAALAGAFTFVTAPTAAQPATLTTYATNAATTYSILGRAIQPAWVTVPSPDLVNHVVTVNINYNEPTYFGGALGIGSAAIAVTASAEAAPNASGSKCVKPFFMPNTAVSASSACAACAGGEKLIDGSPAAVTPYAQNMINAGTPFIIKPGDPSQAMAPGDFFEVDFSGGGGGQYRENIATCAPEFIACGSDFPVLNGNKVGPTKQGVEDLIGRPPTDTYIPIGKYQNTSTGVISNTSQALVTVAIFDTCSGLTCPSNKFTAADAHVLGFALIFIENLTNPQATVHARLVNATACSGALVNSGEATYGGFPIRLVRKTND